jgi:hypothetical protein
MKYKSLNRPFYIMSKYNTENQVHIYINLAISTINLQKYRNLTIFSLFFFPSLLAIENLQNH